MSGPQKGLHSDKCEKDFPGCLCNRCARDGTSADGTSCCAEIRKEYYCGEFDECPAFVPEDRKEET